MTRILITGGAGYVGSLLTINLEKLGHEILIYDKCFYGKDHIKPSNKLKLIEADIRDKNKFESAVQGCDVVIHLACISNDPSFALNESISSFSLSNLTK
jgi:nucleoside-diphosphate-sugar epimerase